MKAMGVASLFGLILALIIIYWLQPLNTGAIALVLLICLSTTNMFAGLFAARKKREKP